MTRSGTGVWPRGAAQEWLRSGSGVAQAWLRRDQEWHRNVAQEQPGSGPGVAQEWLSCGSGMTRRGTGVWPRSRSGPGAAQE